MANNTALIIVDMQDFFLKHFDMATRSTLVANQIKVIRACRRKGVPIFVIEYRCRGVFRGHVTHKLGEVLPKGMQLIVKESNSAFTDTDLHNRLQKLGVKKIVLIGINANACVQDTAMSAIRRGYKVVTAHSVIASGSRKDMELSNRNERWYKAHTELLKSTEDLIASL